MPRTHVLLLLLLVLVYSERAGTIEAISEDKPEEGKGKGKGKEKEKRKREKKGKKKRSTARKEKAKRRQREKKKQATGRIKRFDTSGSCRVTCAPAPPKHLGIMRLGRLRRFRTENSPSQAASCVVTQTASCCEAARQTLDLPGQLSWSVLIHIRVTELNQHEGKNHHSSPRFTNHNFLLLSFTCRASRDGLGIKTRARQDSSCPQRQPHSSTHMLVNSPSLTIGTHTHTGKNHAQRLGMPREAFHL